MENRHPALQIGAAVVALALLVRLFGVLGQDPQALSALVYLQTGRVVRLSAPVPTRPQAEATESTQAEASIPEASATEPEAAPLSIGSLSLSDIEVNYDVEVAVDLQALLEMPLSWDLTDGEPAVLILHTHAAESYTRQAWEEYEESSAYRTLDENYNMVSIGDEVARILEEGGICVIHDRQYHDYPSYSGSYSAARETIAQYLQDYPSIRVVLDLHRDAMDLEDGSQLVTAAVVDGQNAAQIMLVAGTDTNLNFPNWQENLALALKLTAVLEQADPGICRPLNLRAQRFNQDMTSGSLLVEIGASGNTHEEALVAARALAEGILALAHGAQ